MKESNNLLDYFLNPGAEELGMGSCGCSCKIILCPAHAHESIDDSLGHEDPVTALANLDAALAGPFGQFVNLTAGAGGPRRRRAGNRSC